MKVTPIQSVSEEIENMVTHPHTNRGQCCLETVINPSIPRGQWCDNSLQTAIQDELVKAEIVHFHYRKTTRLRLQ